MSGPAARENDVTKLASMRAQTFYVSFFSYEIEHEEKKGAEEHASLEKSEEQDMDFVIVKMSREQAGNLVEIITKIQKSL